MGWQRELKDGPAGRIGAPPTIFLRAPRWSSGRLKARAPSLIASWAAVPTRPTRGVGACASVGGRYAVGMLESRRRAFCGRRVDEGVRSPCSSLAVTT